jgi:Asp-tRNA(Asn)/Glu-tRNA(Gln) amidotransferase A subunit family amidase
MGTFDAYDDFDAMGLAALVQKGETTAEELLETVIERTEQVNGHLNAVVLKHYQLARESIASGLPKGPFQRVPFLLKDLHLLEGTPG